MKKYSLIIAFFLTFFSVDSFGQVYEQIYSVSTPEVQQRIDQNKMAGVDILTGISTHHIIGLAGLAPSQLTSLQNALNSDNRVQSFSVNSDLTSIVLDTQASFTKEQFALLLQPISAVISGYTASYSIIEQ